MKRIFVLFMFYCFCTSVCAQIRVDWQQCYGSIEGDDEAYSLVKTKDGCFVLGYVEKNSGNGMVECDFMGNRHAWLIEIGNEGAFLGQHCFELGGNKLFAGEEDHSMYIVGNVGVGESDNSNIGIIKITTEGEVVWQHAFGAEDHDFWDAPRFARTLDGGFVCSVSICFTGGDIGQYFGFWDDWVVKLDSLGNIEWETTIGTEEGEFSGNMIANPDGTYFALITGSPGENGVIPSCYKPINISDAVVVRLADDGTILDSRCYGGSDNDAFSTVIALDDGFLFVGCADSNDGDLEGAGHHTGYNHVGSPTSDAWLLKTDHDGNVLWSRCYGGKEEDAGCIVFQNDDGGFTVFGVTESYDGDVQSGLNLVYAYNYPYGQKIWVFRTDANGNLLWERAIGNKGGVQYLGDVIQESDTEYIIAATSPAGYNPLYMGDYNCSNYNLCSGDSYWILHITDVFDYDDVKEFLPQENDISVCPNPARDIITVSGQRLLQVWLYDMFGQQVAMALSYNSENAMLDTNGLSAGFYLARVVTENGVVVKRVAVDK